MDAIKELANLDVGSIIIGIFIIFEAAKYIVEAGQWGLSKFGIQFKRIEDKKKDHELLEKMATTIENLEAKSVDKDEQMKKIFESIDTITTSIENLEKKSIANEKATVESLYNTISHQCDHYINDLGGVPSDEVAELTNLMDAYVGCNGNHGLQAKVEYCLKKLPILSPTFKCDEVK